MAHLSTRWSRMLINVTLYIFLIVAINYKVLIKTCWYLSGTSWFEVNKTTPRGIFVPVFFEPWDRPPCSCRRNSEFAAVNLASSKMPNQVVLLIRSISTFLRVKWTKVAIQRNYKMFLWLIHNPEGTLSCQNFEDAAQIMWIKPLKETNLSLARALFDH